MSLPENFCLAPFHRFQISNNKCGPCSYKANVWDIKNRSIKEFWNDRELQELRQSFLDNKKHNLCHLCWKEEESGHSSLRQRLNNFRKSDNISKAIEKYIVNGDYKKFPKVLSVIPGNQCNLACKICIPDASSKLNSELKTYPANFMLQPIQNWNMSDNEYADIVNHSEHIQRIELYGGEPFYNKKNRTQLIDKIIQRGTSKNITLYFNTNCTVYDHDFMDTLSKQFKKVEIRASIDGINEQYEYLRYGGKYKEVMENSKKFYDLDNSDFQIISTISLWNFLYLDDYYDEFCNKYKYSVRWNLVSDTDYLLLHQLPEQAKKLVDLSERFKFVESHIKLTPSDPIAWKKFTIFTKIQDKQRKSSMKDTFPKFYELTKNHGFD